MTDATRSSDFCYRHPDRRSYVLCQRCGRTICPECQTQAAVGVQCPECVREGRASAPRQRPVLVRAMRASGNRPVVTYAIMALCIGVWLLQLIPGLGLTQVLIYAPFLTESQPWRMITSTFAHSPSSIFHILFNMYSLWVFGSILERMLGRWRFLALYLVSGFGGSVAVLLLMSPTAGVLGASGAIFGLLAAFFVIQRKLVGTNVQLLIVIGLNLVIGFVPGLSIAWQAHVGGLIAGAAVAGVYLATRRRDQRNTQIALVALIVVVLVALSVGRVLVGW